MRSFLTYFFLFFLSLTFLAQHSRAVDSLIQRIALEKADTTKLKLLSSLSWKLIRLGELSDAEKFTSKTIELAAKLGNKTELAWAYHYMAIIRQERGDLPGCLDHSFKALKIREQLNDKKGIAASYIIIANNHLIQNNYPDALKYYNEALQISRQTGYRNSEATCHSNIGIVYRRMRKFDKALESQRAALKISEETGDKLSAMRINASIANIYMELGRLDEALKGHQAALKSARETGNKEGVAMATGNIGSVFLEQKKYALAAVYLRKAVDLNKEIGLKDAIQRDYEGLATVDSALGNYTLALEDYRLHVLYRDSMLNEENTRKTVETQLQYEFSKKAAGDSVRNVEARKLEDIKHRQEIKRQRILTWSGATGFLLMIIAAIVSFYAYRNKKQANIEIAQQKNLVEQKQKEILDSIRYAQRIQQALLTSEKFIARKLAQLKGGKP